MSLINEALKKAQKQRQGETEGAKTAAGASNVGSPPVPPRPPLAPPAATPDPEPDPIRQLRREKSGEGSQRFLVIAAIAMGVVVLSVWWRAAGSSDSSDTAVETNPTAITESEPPQQAVASTAVELPAAETLPPSDPDTVEVSSVANAEPVTDVVFQTPTVPDRTEDMNENITVVSREVITVPEPKENRTTTKTEPVEPMAESIPDSAPNRLVVEASTPDRDSAQDVPSSRPQPNAPAVQPPQVVILADESVTASVPETISQNAPDPVVVDFLEQARITGVRASATDPKVLMNNRVFRINDVVDRTLQLRITGIAPRELKFTDSRDFVYTKSF